MPVPANFHGKKGRSGRKCVRDEQLRIRVIEKAWKKKEKKLSDNDATQIVLKDMTEKSSIKVTLPKPLLGGQTANEIPDNDSNQETDDVEETSEGDLRGDERQ